MEKKKKNIWFIAIPLILILGYFIYDAYSQPSIEDLPGGFEEVAFVRKINNAGGIIRIYGVTIKDPLNAQFDQCADLFPVNDYGSVTKIYFFDKDKPYPSSLQLEDPHYDNSKYEAINILSRRGVSK